VPRSPNPADPCERALWLAELETAIAEAQELAWRLGVTGGKREARQLYGRLEALRGELDALRRSGWAGEMVDLPALWPDVFAPPGG
jgi:hypothetical protein